MKKMTKGLILVLCAAVLVVGSVMGTLAWLTAQDTITNTFTVGDIEIDLTETSVSEHKLVPGVKVNKNVAITVSAGSEECYLYVKVENGIAGVEANSGDNKPVVDQMSDNGWKLLTGETDVYYYDGVINTTSGNVTRNVFDYYAVSKAATDLSAFNGKTVVVTAYAVQSAGFGDASAAWTETFGKTGQNP